MWLCRVCAHPWPCGASRLALKAEYREEPVGLAVYLCAQLHEAVKDLERLRPFDMPDPNALFQRFIGWTMLRPPATERPALETPD